jgi:uncharacterized protein
MTTLGSDGRDVAPLEVAQSLKARSRGLLGRDGIEGAILLRPAKSVHTFRMRFPIDVAFCDRGLKVIDTVTMARNRLGRTRFRAHSVIEAEAGALARWGIGAGSQLAELLRRSRKPSIGRYEG